MNVKLNRYPEGKLKAITMSYDDGTVHDIRLVEIFNKYGFKGSFHLNSGLMGKGRRLKMDEIKDLYKGHEISVHTVTHPDFDFLDSQHIFNEIFNDRKALETECGYVVRGMSYPYGLYNDKIVQIAKTAGIACSRTCLATNRFRHPQDFLMWHPTCHHKGDLNGLLDRFVKDTWKEQQLFFIWGHSYEFNDDNNWDVIENFCKRAQNLDDVWYATNIEICDYLTAVRSIVFSADDSMAYNPTNITVYGEADGNIVKLEPGFTKIF